MAGDPYNSKPFVRARERLDKAWQKYYAQRDKVRQAQADVARLESELEAVADERRTLTGGVDDEELPPERAAQVATVDVREAQLEQQLEKAQERHETFIDRDDVEEKASAYRELAESYTSDAEGEIENADLDSESLREELKGLDALEDDDEREAERRRIEKSLQAAEAAKARAQEKLAKGEGLLERVERDIDERAARDAESETDEEFEQRKAGDEALEAENARRRAERRMRGESYLTDDAEEAEHQKNVQTGPRGGRYYTSASGRRVYLGSGNVA